MLNSIIVFIYSTFAAVVVSEVPKNADTSVIGVSLADPDSTEAVLGKDITWSGVVLPKAHFVNATKTEELIVTAHNGDDANSVAEFLVSSLPQKRMTSEVLKTVEHFTSGKGIHLGMTMENLVNVLGTPAETENDGARTIYRYEIKEMSTSAFLQHYNMPGYYGTYSFTNDMLIEYSFGFVYP